MASSRDGVGHLSSTSLVFGEETSTPSRDGRDRKGLRTPQAVKEEITGNSRILAEHGWDSVTSPLWVCNMAKKYVKMHHIDKLFLEAVWKYNHRVSGVKPGESNPNTLRIVRLKSGPLYIQINPLVRTIRILFLILWRRWCTLK
jgi:hypothetical protein